MLRPGTDPGGLPVAFKGVVNDDHKVILGRSRSERQCSIKYKKVPTLCSTSNLQLKHNQQPPLPTTPQTLSKQTTSLSATMKISQLPIILAMLVPAIAAMPAGESNDVSAKVDAGTLSCGAAGSCKGVGGGSLCNDRVSTHTRIFHISMLTDANLVQEVQGPQWLLHQGRVRWYRLAVSAEPNVRAIVTMLMRKKTGPANASTVKCLEPMGM